ncbi:MAG: serine/threonine protein kinase, partial [Saccharothrix sp.]|nr:serine/threonine protein kinase [Saccharothrix sp.]
MAAGSDLPGSAGGDRAADHDRVRDSARHARRDYRLEPRPAAEGGQARVFRAVHRPTSTPVAFKQLKSGTQGALARMRREIEAARRFADHPNVMPVLDFGEDHRWFVMPLAEGTASDAAADLADDRALRDLVTAVCEALRGPHREGWIHRDVKPDNVLRLHGRWVVADWGLGRRPRGQTTSPHRTEVGTNLGTEGFAAPELAVDAHAAGPQADVYSIGQLIGWALTGALPRPNVPLLPPSGPWRAVVKEATRHAPEQRPADVDALLAL